MSASKEGMVDDHLDEEHMVCTWVYLKKVTIQERKGVPMKN